MKKAILILFVSCIFFSSCAKGAASYFFQTAEREYEQNKTEFLLKGQFFEEIFMEKAELSWLGKPANAKNEHFLNNDYEYIYQCDFLSQAEFRTFLETVYDGFSVQEYAFGSQAWEIGSSLDTVKSLGVKPFLTLEEYKDEECELYTFYYSAQGTEWSELKRKMRMIEAKKLTISVAETGNYYQMTVTLFTKVAPVYIFYDLPLFVKD